MVDHGIEPEAERKKLQKDIQGTISIKIFEMGENIKISFQDDGGGIDVNKIKKVAEAKGLKLDEHTSEKDLLNLIFNPNFSTKDKGDVGDISGRGIGMATVKKTIEELNGTIEIESELKRGCQFNIIIPQ